MILGPAPIAIGHANRHSGDWILRLRIAITVKVHETRVIVVVQLLYNTSMGQSHTARPTIVAMIQLVHEVV